MCRLFFCKKKKSHQKGLFGNITEPPQIWYWLIEAAALISERCLSTRQEARLRRKANFSFDAMVQSTNEQHVLHFQACSRPPSVKCESDIEQRHKLHHFLLLFNENTKFLRLVNHLFMFLSCFFTFCIDWHESNTFKHIRLLKWGHYDFPFLFAYLSIINHSVFHHSFLFVLISTLFDTFHFISACT